MNREPEEIDLAGEDDDDEEMEVEEEDDQLERLLECLREIASPEYDLSEVIDLQKARNILEATSDVAEAARLYWDDFLATRNQQQPQNNNPSNAHNDATRKKKNRAGIQPKQLFPDVMNISDDEGILKIHKEKSSDRSKKRMKSNVQSPNPSAGWYKAQIPLPWTHASFSRNVSVLKLPDEADLGYNSWFSKAEPHKIPFPYHCRSITAVLAIVNALAHETSLKEALVQILRLCAKQYIAKQQRENVCVSPVSRRRAKLIPVCWWNGPNGSPPEETKLLFTTSLTHFDDLENYVVSNLHHFVSPGGVALFLETIFRISGVTKPLVNCQCEQRHQAQLEDLSTLQKLKVAAKSNPLLDTSPKGKCIETGLISLLLSGIPHKQYDFESPLGLGVLQQGVRPALLKPRRALWIIPSAESYSTLTTEGSQINNFSTSDASDGVSILTQRNVYLSEPRKIRFKLINDRSLAGAASTIPMECSAPIEVVTEDQEFYDDFRLWRYKTGTSVTHFHQLTDAQKYQVESTYGPALLKVLRVRWPRASIEMLDVADET